MLNGEHSSTSLDSAHNWSSSLTILIEFVGLHLASTDCANCIGARWREPNLYLLLYGAEDNAAKYASWVSVRSTIEVEQWRTMEFLRISSLTREIHGGPACTSVLKRKTPLDTSSNTSLRVVMQKQGGIFCNWLQLSLSWSLESSCHSSDFLAMVQVVTYKSFSTRIIIEVREIINASWRARISGCN